MVQFHSFAYSCPAFPTPFVKRLSFSHCLFSSPLLKINSLYNSGFISGFSILFHWLMHPFLCSTILFSRVAVPVCIPTSRTKASSFSTSLPKSVVAWVVHFSHYDRCEMVSHCGFDFYFPDDEWYWASFHVSVSHLMSAFEKCLFMSSHHFFTGLFVFLVLSLASSL